MLARRPEPRNIAGMSDLRNYAIAARSTDTFGRVLCSARAHHFIIDGPVQNGCPGEELTPPEAFLAGVAACGVELIQVLGRQQGHENIGVKVQMQAMLDRIGVFKNNPGYIPRTREEGAYHVRAVEHVLSQDEAPVAGSCYLKLNEDF